MSDSILPQKKLPKLIVVVAFDRDEHGELLPAFGPAEQQSEDRAVRTARALVDKHVGVIAWSRDADLEPSEYGPPTALFRHGDLRELDQSAMTTRSRLDARMYFPREKAQNEKVGSFFQGAAG